MPKKPLSYTLSALAESDLLNAFVLGIENWGIVQAQKYADQIEKAFNTLAEFPNIGNDCSQLFPKAQSFPVGRHTIYYRKINGSIEIARVLHQHMDEKPQFK